MTPTEDELARLAELEDLLTVGLVEQPINGSVLSWGEAALIAHRIGRHLLRAAPVADTAGIDAEALAEAMWFEGLIDDHGPEGAAAKEAAESLAGAYRGMLKHRAALSPSAEPSTETT